MVAALGLRLWALRFQPWVTVDGTEYIRFADALGRGQAFPSIFPPGYPALIALAHLLVLDRVAAAAAVSMLCGALLPWPTWLLARRALGPRWAALPALAVALHPALIQCSTLTLSESAYLLALYGALALAAAARALPAGLSIGAAFAIRPEALLPAAALTLREALWAGRAARKPRAVPAALCAAGFLALATPCWLYFHATLGEWMLTPKVAAAVRAQARTWREEEPRLAARDSVAAYSLGARLARYGPATLRRTPGNAVQYGRRLLALWPAPLLLLSLWGLARRRGVESLPLLQLLVLPMLAISVQSRFLLGAVPALAILAALPFTALSGRRALLAIGAAWLAGAAWCGARLGPDLVQPLDGNLGADQDAGEWLAGAAEPGAPVMDRKPYVAFYADRPYRVMPDEPYDVLLDAAVQSGVRYLVINEGVVRIFRPQLLKLVYDRAFLQREPRLEMVYFGGRFKGYGVIVYRVLRSGEAKTGRPPAMSVRWLGRGGPEPGS